MIELIDQKGVSESQMSKDLGRSKTFIQSYTSGRAMPKMAAFFAICDYLEVTPAQFFNVPEENENSVYDKLVQLIFRLPKDVQESLYNFLASLEGYR